MLDGWAGLAGLGLVWPRLACHVNAPGPWNGFCKILQNPFLGWPALTWADLGWPELAWAGLHWPGLA